MIAYKVFMPTTLVPYRKGVSCVVQGRQNRTYEIGKTTRTSGKTGLCCFRTLTAAENWVQECGWTAKSYRIFRAKVRVLHYSPPKRLYKFITIDGRVSRRKHAYRYLSGWPTGTILCKTVKPLEVCG